MAHLCGERQMTSSEFMAAVRMGVGYSDQALLSATIKGDIILEDDLLDACRNLVVLDKGFFRVAHLSVREYFEQHTDFTRSSVQELATLACVYALIRTRMDEGEEVAASPRLQLSNSFGQYAPLLQLSNSFENYAALFWVYHLIQLSMEIPSHAVQTTVKLFLLDGCEATYSYLEWIKNIVRHFRYHYRLQGSSSGGHSYYDVLDTVANTTPAYPVFFISIFGFTWLFEHLLTKEQGRLPRPMLAASSDSYSGIHLATMYNHQHIVERFLQIGVDIDQPGKYGYSALLTAILYNHQELAEFLTHKGANVNTCADLKDTPLHITAWRGLDEITLLLLQYGALVDAKNWTGKTPLNLAAQSREDGSRQKMIQLLLDWNARCDIKDDGGKTAIDVARSGDRSMFKFITLRVRLSS